MDAFQQIFCCNWSQLNDFLCAQIFQSVLHHHYIEFARSYYPFGYFETNSSISFYFLEKVRYLCLLEIASV